MPNHPELGWITTVHETTARRQAERDLQKALQEQLAIFDNAVVGIVYQRNRKIENCNSRFAALWGYTRDEIIGQSTRVFYISQEKWERRGALALEAVSNGEAYVFEEEFIRKDGGHVWCRVYGRAIDPVHPDTCVYVYTDITEQKRAEQELRAGREQLDLVIRAEQGGIWDWDIVNDTNHFSSRYREILGYHSDADAGELFLTGDRVHPEDRERIRAAQDHHLNERLPFDHEFRLRGADGSYVWVRGRGQAVWDQNGKPIRFVGSIIEISDRKQAEEQMRALAQQDSLTGLPNRRLLDDRLQQALAHAQRDKKKLAVLLLDLDGFKEINDDHGHETGDAVLVTTAHRLKECFRATDTVARFGGDEFVAVLEGQNSMEDSTPVAEKILSLLREPIRVGDRQFKLTASIGIAIYPSDSENAETLLRLADQAMYESKASGGDTFRFYSALSATGRFRKNRGGGSVTP